MPENPEFLFSAISALAAFTAVVISIWAVVISRRSLRLSEEQRDARQPNLLPYLINSFMRRLENGEGRIYAFSISMSNRSDANNAMASIELGVTYKRDDQLINNVILPHEPRLIDEFPLKDIDFLVTPQQVGAHDTIAGWIIFALSDFLLGDANIEGLEIIFKDSHGVRSCLTPIVIKDIMDEPAVALNKD